MGNWNDGGLGIGSRKVKIYPSTTASDASGNTNWSGTTAKGIYILESFNPSRPQKVLDRTDEVGNPNGGAGLDGVPTASAVVQLPYVTATLVDTGDAFTTLRRNGSAESWVVTSADEGEQQGEVRKQNINLRKIVSSPSGNWAPVYP